jgi:hypothetical protein
MDETPEDSRTCYDAIAADLVTMGSISSKMFGMPCLKIEGKAFAGYHHGAMVFKLQGEAHAEALALTGSHLFDPAGGRPMREWVEVPAQHAEHWTKLGEAALNYVGGMHSK